jgi:hypothetical protein
MRLYLSDQTNITTAYISCHKDLHILRAIFCVFWIGYSSGLFCNVDRILFFLGGGGRKLSLKGKLVLH